MNKLYLYSLFILCALYIYLSEISSKIHCALLLPTAYGYKGLVLLLCLSGELQHLISLSKPTGLLRPNQTISSEKGLKQSESN